MSSKSWILFIIFFIVGIMLGHVSSGANKSSTQLPSSSGVRISGPFFCPEDHCSSVVVHWISRANSSIDLAIYSFTLDTIGEALVNAHERGVTVRVIFEKTQINQWSEYSKLKSAGIQVMIDRNDKYMHNKFMVIDGKVVLTGSYNYSKQADTQNDENLIVIISEDVAKAYESEFNEMWEGKFGS